MPGSKNVNRRVSFVNSTRNRLRSLTNKFKSLKNRVGSAARRTSNRVRSAMSRPPKTYMNYFEGNQKGVLMKRRSVLYDDLLDVINNTDIKNLKNTLKENFNKKLSQNFYKDFK